jgi:hypothetical protein
LPVFLLQCTDQDESHAYILHWWFSEFPDQQHQTQLRTCLKCKI